MIEAVFSNGERRVQTKAVYQWDYGQVLRIIGLDLPKATEIHFAVSGSEEAVTRIAVERDDVSDVVVPDSMLEQTSPITAYIYLTDDESGQTVYEIHTSIKERPKPEAFDRPEDAEMFREAIDAVNTSAVKAARSESQAATYADTANKSAVAAVQAKQDAERAAQSAGQSAADADSFAKKAQDLVDSLPTDFTAMQTEVSQLKYDLADKVPKNDYAPETKTESMTQPVGKDENGKLWTTPGSGGSGGAVSSVNGKTGAVVLTAEDVHALHDDIVIPTVPTNVSAFTNDAGYLTKEDIGGNAGFKTDETLSLKDGVLSVNTTNDMEQDNTLPITSAGVYATVGNIEALLKTI